MQIPQKDRTYTYADYLTWGEEQRWEIIAGTPYLLSSPSWEHQAISGGIFAQFYSYLQGKPCQVFSAPFDVRLPLANEDDADVQTVVQPDLAVVCERSGLRGSGYYGVPALIVEISSPSTAKLDKVLKLNKYEQSGVEEYWIVEPESRVILVFSLQANKRYGRPATYTDEDQIPVGLLPELVLDMPLVFAAIDE